VSIQWISAVLHDTQTNGSERLVLIAIANHANERGECWPSVRTIAQEANVHYDTCRRSAAQLEKQGIVTRAIKQAPDERIPPDKRPNLWTIVGIENPHHPTNPDRLGQMTPGGQGSTGANRLNDWGESSDPTGANGPSKPSMNLQEPSSPIVDRSRMNPTVVSAANEVAKRRYAKRAKVDPPVSSPGAWKDKVMSEVLEEFGPALTLEAGRKPGADALVLAKKVCKDDWAGTTPRHAEFTPETNRSALTPEEKAQKISDIKAGMP